MERKVEEIKVVREEGREGTVESHPSFGSITFSRLSGNPGKLFGSNLENHQSYITLRIKKCERHHSYSEDQYFSKGAQLVEVDLSAAQFAELITTMNVGSGVPCTLRYVSKDGQGAVPEFPQEDKVEVERIEEEFNEALKDRVEKLKQYESEIAEILEKKSIGKGDRARIKNLTFQARRFFIDNAPFVVTQINEAQEKLVSHAKSEVEAFVMNAVITAGLESFKATPQITEGEADNLGQE